MIQSCLFILPPRSKAVPFYYYRCETNSRRYLFGKQSNEFLSSTNAHLGIAFTCLSYLSFECFDEDAFSIDFTSNILSGDYVLLIYAAEWPEHVRSCAHHLQPESVQSLGDTISVFLDARENCFYEAGRETHHAAKTQFLPFKDWPHVFSLLVEMSVFMRKKKFDLIGENGNYYWLSDSPSLYTFF
jgi:hypothetical protein